MAKQSPKRILINAKSAEKIKRYYEKTGQKVPTTIENGTANKSTISRLVKRVNNERKNGTEKYRIKLNEIKPFTNLKHLNASKLTPSQKGTITRIRKEIAAPLATGGFVYSPATDKNRKIARDSLGLKSKHIIHIPIVSDDGKTTNAHIRKGKLVVESSVSESEIFLFDKNDLMLFGQDYINEYLDILKEDGWERFRIMTGGGELSNGNAFPINRAKEKFSALLNLAGATGENVGGSGADFDKWMLGVKAVRYKQSDLSKQQINKMRKDQRNSGFGRSKRNKKKGK